jgi:hypothetical protein
MYVVFDNSTSIVVAQGVLDLAAGILFSYSVYRLHRRSAVLSAIAVSLHLTSGLSINIDASYISESLFTSCIIFSFSFLLLGFATRKTMMFALASGSAGCAMLTRPAGLFLVGILILVSLYAVWNRRARLDVVALTAPCGMLLLLLCTYNLYTVKNFTASTHGEQTFALLTLPFWEENARYPADINAAIVRVKVGVRERLIGAGVDPNTIYYSTDPAAIRRFFWPVSNAFGLIAEIPAADENERGRWWRTLVLHSLRNHPKAIAKAIAAGFHGIYIELPRLDADFFPPLNTYLNNVHCRQSDPLDVYRRDGSLFIEMTKEWAVLPQGSCKYDSSGESLGNVITPSKASEVYRVLRQLRTGLFASPFFSGGLAISFFLSMAFLIKARGRHDGALILYVLCLGHVTNSLIVALNTDFSRYSYPFQWVPYACLALLPLLAKRVLGSVDPTRPASSREVLAG